MCSPRWILQYSNAKTYNTLTLQSTAPHYILPCMDFPHIFLLRVIHKYQALHPTQTLQNGMVKADKHTACRAHGISLPCCAAKGSECFFPIWFTQCGCVWFTLAMPCSDHAILLKAMAQHGRQETACGLPSCVWLLPATTRGSTKTVIRSIPILLTTIHTYGCKEW